MPELLGAMAPQHGFQWDGHLEHQLSSASADRMWASVKALSARRPAIPVAVAGIAGGFAIYRDEAALISFAREVGTTRTVTDDDIDELEHFYASRGFPVRIWISDRTDPSALRILLGRGYFAHAPIQTWWRPLQTGFLPKADAIEIVTVSPENTAAWTSTVAAGFMEQGHVVKAEELPEAALDVYFALGCAPGDQALLARRKGEYVGGAVLTPFEEIAMLRTASTRFVHRNSGVHQSLIAARLRMATQQGARVAVTQTPTQGPSAHNVVKFGFRPLRVGYIVEKSIIGCEA
jgi:hypothetical protein